MGRMKTNIYKSGKGRGRSRIRKGRVVNDGTITIDIDSKRRREGYERYIRREKRKIRESKNAETREWDTEMRRRRSGSICCRTGEGRGVEQL
jgi:hypothetical protein